MRVEREEADVAVEGRPDLSPRSLKETNRLVCLPHGVEPQTCSTELNAVVTVVALEDRPSEPRDLTAE